MNLQGKTVLVAGCGISGIAAVNLLYEKGIRTILYDSNDKLEAAEIAGRLSDGVQTEILLGEMTEETIRRTDVLVLSPGIPTDLPFVEAIRSAGIPIIGEIELAYLCGKGRVIGITGTNGKTTTTALTGQIMKNYFDSVFVVGNIGIPYTGVAAEMTKDTVTVAEISSFQLETIDSFCPQVSAVLNVTPDHLNRHHTMEKYIQAKEDIAKNQRKDQVCILNYDNANTRRMAEHIRASVLFFSRLEKLEQGVCLEQEQIVYRDHGRTEVICPLSAMQLVGNCNVENVMAASAIAVSMGVPTEIIEKTIREFKAVEHRIEFVKEVNGVRYYNDSKGTNPDAAIQGIQAMDRPTVLLAGGYDKQSEYDEWLKACEGKVKALILIGQTREKIQQAAMRHRITNILLKDTFEEAMKECEQQAESGDAVLLSPACASWGMFDNYEQRGNLFKEYVRGIQEHEK